jgi:hypothetical protein
VCVAERSLPEDFDGVLGWGWMGNRRFLRCLHGLTLSAWRLELYEEAEELCWALLAEPWRPPRCGGAAGEDRRPAVVDRAAR